MNFRLGAWALGCSSWMIRSSPIECYAAVAWLSARLHTKQEMCFGKQCELFCDQPIEGKNISGPHNTYRAIFFFNVELISRREIEPWDAQGCFSVHHLAEALHFYQSPHTNTRITLGSFRLEL
jgi:hypothetical protein